MSQFRPRFQQPPAGSQARDVDVKLRMQHEAYASEHAESPYTRRQVETQKIKSLSFWENSDSEGNEDNDWSDRQSPTPYILAVIILVVASTLLWFLFRWASGENTNTPPIIAADTAPFKVRPENPGGMMIPHQDKLIYGRLSQDTQQPIERLLPPPEQPMAAVPPPMNAPQMGPPQMGAPQNNQVQQQPYPQQQGYAQPQHGYTPNPAIQHGPQPQPDPQRPQPYPQYPPQGPYPQQQPVSGQSPQAQPQQVQQFPEQQIPGQPLQGQAPYPVPPQSQPPYGLVSSPPAAVQPPTPQIPLIAAANPELPKQLSAVEGIKPASSDEDETDDDTPPIGRSELDQLIAKEAETPLKRSVKKNDKPLNKPMPMDPENTKCKSPPSPLDPWLSKR